MPRRDGQPQHIRPGAGVAGSHRVDKPSHLTGEDRFGGDHPVQPAELADVVGIGAAFEHEGVDEPTVKAHPHPDSGLSVVRLLRRHQIVELTVQVRNRQHGQNPGNGLVFGGVAAGCAHTNRLFTSCTTAGSRPDCYGSRGCWGSARYRFLIALRRSESSKTIEPSGISPRDRLRSE